MGNRPKKNSMGEEAECPLPEFELVELVEVVTQDKEKWVKGAGMDCTDTVVITEKVDRVDKNGAHFKQYINLEKNSMKAGPDDPNKRHPEYGREITFKARIKRKDANTENLNGVKVNFKFSCTKAVNRAAPDADIWADAELTGAEKGGFGTGRTASKSENTDDKGWTLAVSFFTSQYGGDQFEISAELDPSVKGSGAPAKKTQAKYEVWRKFWYQMTYFKDYRPAAPPVPQTAVDAYKEVYAEMARAKLEKKEFEETDITDVDLKKRTFVKEYMVKLRGSNVNKAAVIGYHNTGEFKKMRPHTGPNKAHKLTSNLIITNYQCDSVDADCATAVIVKELTSNLQEVIVTDAKIVCDPPLKAGTNLVIGGEWSKTDENPALHPPTHWHKEANLTDSDIEIDPGRDALNKIKVKRPAGARDTDKVFFKLKILATKSFAGCAAGDGQVVCVYTGAANGLGTVKDYNETVGHEIGHLFNQTIEPVSPTPPARSLKDHPLQYVAHGGSGSHCLYDAQGGSAAGIGIYSQNIRTTITTAKTDKYHDVADHKGFINGHKVKVDGNEKTMKKRWVGELEFDEVAFAANVGDAVVQTFTGFDEGRTNTTITAAAGVATQTHEVAAKASKFKVGEKVKVNNVDRGVVQAVVDETHLKFSTSFTAAVGDKVVAQLDWNNAKQDFPAPFAGECVMFHSSSDHCNSKFCKTCKPYLQLQNMSKFK